MSRLSKLVTKAAKNYMEDVAVISTTGMSVADPNDETSYTPGTESRSIQKALVSYTAAMQSSLRDFLEQFHVDVVIDFFPTADLSGDNVRFVVNGEEFAQKETSKELADYYTRAGKERIFRTVSAVRTGRIEGRIRYVSSSEQVDLYHYDVASGAFVWSNDSMIPGRASMTVAGDSVQFAFGAADPVMEFAGGSLQVSSGISLAAPVVTVTPRLEFYVGPVPVAALTGDGTLTVRNARDSQADPLLRRAMIWKGASGQWLFGMSESGVYAPGIGA